MSAAFTSNICPEVESNHQFLQPRSVAILKRNSMAGCQLCSLVYRALESFQLSWFKEHGDRVQFSRIEFLDRSLRINMFLDQGTVGESMVYAELVYEQLDLKPESFLNATRNLKQLGDVYSTLGILPGRKVPSFPEQDIDLMRNWIQQCIVNHPRCQTDYDRLLPKRVIDVGISAEGEVQLYESNGKRANYAALSHRWGQHILLTTIKSTLHARKQAIQWLMGLRYIWIDSLCIVQDDAVDWQIESSKMAIIYENTFVTISANNSTGMLLGPPAMMRSHSVQLEAADPDGKLQAIIIRSPLNHEKFFGTSQRELGWVVPNENMTTHYPNERGASKKDYWQHEFSTSPRKKLYSNAKLTANSLYSGITLENFTPTSTAITAWDGWQRVVSPYIQKEITNPLDILPALAGLASRVQCKELGYYVAGLWSNELAVGLFWFADIVSSRNPRIKSAPSFSWASLAGTSKVKELQWQWWSPDEKVKQAYKILEIHCPVASPNHYGTVSDGFVRLQGYVLAIKLRNEQVRPFNSVVRSKTCEQRAIAFMDRDLITEMTTERDFVCLPGFTWSEGSWNSDEAKQKVSALILERVGTDVYQRAGCLPFLGNDPSWERDAEEKEITII